MCFIYVVSWELWVFAHYFLNLLKLKIVCAEYVSTLVGSVLQFPIQGCIKDCMGSVCVFSCIWSIYTFYCLRTCMYIGSLPIVWTWVDPCLTWVYIFFVAWEQVCTIEAWQLCELELNMNFDNHNSPPLPICLESSFL